MTDWARPVVHWAITAVDPAAQCAFYGALFGWDITPGSFAPINAGLGGPEPGPGGHIQGGAQPGVSLYIQVRDLQETLDRAVELGGTITAAPFELPNTPSLAGIKDPEGNDVMLVQQ